MGFLPILVTLLGFAFLWGIVNYYSIRQRKEDVDEALEKVYQKASERRRLLEGILKAQPESFLAKKTCVLLARASTKDRQQLLPSQKLNEEEAISQTLKALFPQLEQNGVTEALVNAQKEYHQAVGTYKLRVAEYQELTKKQPSKLVAWLTGYKPLSS
ncbi:MAG: hypothetical protein ACLFUB_04505 [Cyclobacteriaceae bacterium]